MVIWTLAKKDLRLLLGDRRAMVILLAMYTTIFERTREIGILKSLGASKGFIVGMILRESVMICCLGLIFGTGASAIIRRSIIAAFPPIQFRACSFVGAAG